MDLSSTTGLEPDDLILIRGRVLPAVLRGHCCPLYIRSIDNFGEDRTWSGKRDSNPQPSAWKADALPIELFPLTYSVVTNSLLGYLLQRGLENYGGGGRI